MASTKLRRIYQRRRHPLVEERVSKHLVWETGTYRLIMTAEYEARRSELRDDL